MLDTSKDILYIVISFSILWLTVFICWALYHLGKVLKNANEIIDEFRSRIDALAEAIDYIQHKLEQVSGLATVATRGITGYVSKMAGKKAEDFFDEATSDMSSVARAAVKKATKLVGEKAKKTAKKTRSTKKKTKKK